MEETQKKSSLLSKIMKFLIPLIVTVGLCWMMFKKIDFKEMMDIITHQCNFVWIGVALAMSILSHVFRALRWNIQLRALGVKAPLYVLVLSIFGTYAVNLVFPRLGEIWRTSYVSTRQKASFSTVFGSMVADRLADTVTVVLITIVVFLFASTYILKFLAQNEETYNHLLHIISSPWLWLAIVLVIACLWFFFTRKATPGSLLDKIQGFARGIWQGFIVIGKMDGKGMWLVYTICLWGCYFSQLYIAFYAFSFTTEALHQYGIIVPLVCFVLSSIAMGVPSNGGIGPWQWAVMFGLECFGAGTYDMRMAFANTVLGTQTLLLIVLGIFTFIAIALDKKRQVTKAEDEPGQIESEIK